MIKKLITMAVLTVFSSGGFIYAAEDKMELSPKQKSIVLISALTAKGDLDKLAKALNEGLDNGLSINEIKEILVQMYAYTGFPRSLNGITTFESVLKERQAKGIEDPVGVEPAQLPKNKTKYQTGKDNLAVLVGEKNAGNSAAYAQFVPIIEVFLKEHLFSDIFARGILTFEEREIATVSALATLGNVNAQMQSHMNIALNTGLKDEQGKELTALIKKNIGRKEGKNAEAVYKKVLESRKAK